MTVVTQEERTYLQELAKKVREIAADPVQAERRRMWYALNSLEPVKPLVFCSPEGSWIELIPPETIRCQDPQLAAWELNLRQRIYTWEHFADDQVTDPVIEVGRVFTETALNGVSAEHGWGVDIPQHRTGDSDRGSWVWDPPIKELDDLDKLTFPTVTIDEEASQKRLELAQDLFGDILEIRQYTSFWWSLGIMRIWSLLRGLETMMMDMVLYPEWTHRACRFLTDGVLHFIDEIQDRGELCLNTGNHYVGSGSFGFTHELPTPSGAASHVTTKNMWGFTEAQEITAISPTMHWEFALQYEMEIHERFGLTYYGCCEPLDRKFEYVKRLPNLRAVSISPWCDREIAAQELGADYVYSWKPHPTHLAGVQFDGDYVRQYLRQMLEETRGCVVTMALKDTHTCSHQPQRFDEWTRIAQEETKRAAERS